MMASPFSLKKYKYCQDDNKETKARALCFECQKLLCEACASKHLNLKDNQNHNLIDLVPFFVKSTTGQKTLYTTETTSSTNDESELSSDFLNHVTLTENTVLYRGAQVAMGSVSSKLRKQDSSLSSVDPSKLKAKKSHKVSVKRSDDKREAWVRGILSISNSVIILDHNNRALKLFDMEGKYLSSTEVKEMTWGMSLINDNTFVTCGFGKKLYLWSIQDQKIVNKDVAFDVDHDAYSVCCNGRYCCVLHSIDSTITVLDNQGKNIRKINITNALGKTFKLGYDLKMDNETSNIYVQCWNEDGVLCVTIEGNPLWFTSLSATQGIDVVRGTLCVADCKHGCLHLMTKEGEYTRKLLEKANLRGLPKFVHFGKGDNLYVSYVPYDDNHDMIFVYKV